MAAETHQDGQPAVKAPALETAPDAFIENLRAPVAFLDRAGNIRYMNAAAMRLLEHDDLGARLEMHLRTRQNKAKISQVKFRLGDGSERILRIEVSSAQWMGQLGYQAFLQDATPYLTAIQQVQEKAKAAAGGADLAADVLRETGERMRFQKGYQQARAELALLKSLLHEMQLQRDELQAVLQEREGQCDRAGNELQAQIAAREQAQQEVERLRQQAADSARQAQELAGDREELAAEVRQRTDALAAARQDLQTALAEHARIRQEGEAHTHGLEAAEQQLQAETAARERAQQEAAQARKEAAEALANARKESDDEVAKREQVEREKALLEKRGVELGELLASLQAERDQLDTLARERADELAQVGEKLQEQTSEWKKSQESNTSLAREVAELKRGAEEMKSQRDVLEERVKRSANDLAEAGDRIRQGTQERELAQQENEQIRLQVGQLTATRDNLEVQRDEMAQQAARSAAQLEKAKWEFHESATALEQARLATEQLRQEAADSARKAEELGAREEKLARQIQESAEALTNIRRELKAETAVRTRSQQETAQAQQEAVKAVENARKEAEAAAAARNRAQLETAEARKEADAEVSKRQRVEREKALFEKMSVELSEWLVSLQAECDRLGALVRERADELAQTGEKLQEQTSEWEKSQESNTSLAREVAKLKRAAEEMKSQRDLLEEQVKWSANELISLSRMTYWENVELLRQIDLLKGIQPKNLNLRPQLEKPGKNTEEL